MPISVKLFRLFLDKISSPKSKPANPSPIVSPSKTGPTLQETLSTLSPLEANPTATTNPNIPRGGVAYNPTAVPTNQARIIPPTISKDDNLNLIMRDLEEAAGEGYRVEPPYEVPRSIEDLHSIELRYAKGDTRLGAAEDFTEKARQNFSLDEYMDLLVEQTLKDRKLSGRR